MPMELLIILALTLFNGLFSAAEIAVLSVRRTRVAELSEEGSRGAQAVQWRRAQPERFLATVQIGITVIGTTAAAFGGDTLAEDFARWMAPRAPWLGEGAHRVALVLVIALISYLGIVLGELVPKSIALRHAERIALALSVPLRLLARAAKPLVWLFTASSNAILRLVGDHTSFTEARLSPEEIQELVEEAGRTGSIDAQASEIASRAIDFRELTAGDVMVPRESIVAVPRDLSAEALERVLEGRRFARLPVYEHTPENLIGYVSLKDLLPLALRGRPAVAECTRPVRFVPTTMPAATLLRAMQSERLPLVLVIDETGGVRGLVTVEDLVEEVVGEILSEGDPAPPSFERGADGAVVVPGTTPIREVNRALDLELDEPDGVNTVAGLCIHVAGRLPAPGERVTLRGGHVLEVLDATPRKVRALRIHPATSVAPSAP